MRILVDLLSLGYGGSETYPRAVFPHFADSEHEVFCILPQGKGAFLRSDLHDRIHFLDASVATSNPVSRARYQRFRLPEELRRLKADVLFVPGGVTGIRNAPHFRLVTMLRNMLPFDVGQRSLFPIHRYPRKRLRYWLLRHGLTRTFRDSDRVIFISDYSKERVLSCVRPPDYRVIPHGVQSGSQGEEQSTDDVLRRFRVKQPYMLYVSIFQPYKHQLEVIEGFERYRSQRVNRSDTQLVLAGPTPGEYGKRVLSRARKAGESVICTGAVERDALPGLVRRADILLFGSTCETCPNILLEYLIAGRPIVCSDTAPMPEFGSDSAIYVRAGEAAAWAGALQRLDANEKLKQELGERAKQRATRFSWAETASRTLDALTQW